MNAARDRKVIIANQVIDIVAKNGSRFLQETEPGSGQFYRISEARAIEKCCQALREKVISTPPAGNPFERVSKKRDVPSEKVISTLPAGNPFEKVSKKRDVPSRDVNNPKKKANASSPSAPAASKKSNKKSSPVTLKLPLAKQKRNYTRKQPDPPLSGGSGKSHDGVGGSKQIRISPVRSLLPKKKDPAVNVVEIKKEKKKVMTIPEISQPDIVLLMESPMDRLKRLSSEEMLKRLDRFIDEHHHAAVPPGWPADPDLADWCTIQRQHLRMAKKGYKELGPQEKELLTKLSSLSFVWDYGERNLNQTTSKA